MLSNSLQAVRSDRACARPIVRSKPPHLKGSKRNCCNSFRNPRGSYLPETKILAIQQRYIRGDNKSAIAKAEGVDRGTVARIVQFPEVQNFIAQMQQEFFGLVPDAMAAVRHALQVEKDAKVAYQILEATGVAPHQGERLHPEATEEDGLDRQSRLIAAVLVESHRNFGVDLSPELEKIANDPECQDAKAPEVKVSRR